jgi:hypothetical protein
MPLHVAEAAGLIWAGIGGKRLLDHPFSAAGTSAAADGARAWWQFLDERQTAA